MWDLPGPGVETCPLHWQVDSLPQSHQGDPVRPFSSEFFGYSAGGLIHILLVIAVIAIILRLIQGRKPL